MESILALPGILLIGNSSTTLSAGLPQSFLLNAVSTIFDDMLLSGTSTHLLFAVSYFTFSY